MEDSEPIGHVWERGLHTSPTWICKRCGGLSGLYKWGDPPESGMSIFYGVNGYMNCEERISWTVHNR